MPDFPLLNSSQPLGLLEQSTRGDETVKFPIRRGWTNLDVPLSWTELTKPITHGSAILFFFSQQFGDISQNIKCSFQFVKWRNIVKHGEIVILIPIALFFRVIAPTIPLWLMHTHKFSRNTLVPPQTTHGGTLCSWVGWTKFWVEEGAGRERKRLFCIADWFASKSDSVWLVAIGSLGRRGSVWWVHADFWQNRSQLRGLSAVCASHHGCVSLTGLVREVWSGGVLHQCWVIRAHPFWFEESRVIKLLRRGRRRKMSSSADGSISHSGAVGHTLSFSTLQLHQAPSDVRPH